MSAVSFPVRPSTSRRTNCPEDSYNRPRYRPTPTNPKGEHRAVDIDREDLGVETISNYIIQLPEKAKLIAKGYDDEGAGFWMEWQVLRGPWKGRYMRFFHMIRACSLAIGTVKNRKYAVGRVGNTGRSTGAHLHFELGKYSIRRARDPRWNPTQALCDAVRGRDY